MRVVDGPSAPAQPAIDSDLLAIGPFDQTGSVRDKHRVARHATRRILIAQFRDTALDICSGAVDRDCYREVACDGGLEIATAHRIGLRLRQHPKRLVVKSRKVDYEPIEHARSAQGVNLIVCEVAGVCEQPERESVLAEYGDALLEETGECRL